MGTPFNEIGPQYEMVDPAPADSHHESSDRDKTINGIVSTFKKSEVNPVKMEIYYDTFPFSNSELWIHQIVFPVWKSLSKSGKKCLVLLRQGMY